MRVLSLPPVTHQLPGTRWRLICTHLVHADPFGATGGWRANFRRRKGQARSARLLDDGPGLDLDPGTERERGCRKGGPCWEPRAKELSVGTIEGRPIRDVSQVHIDFDDLLSCNTGVGEDVAEIAERLLELGPEAALDHLPVVAQADLTGRGDRLSNPTPWAERSDRLYHESLLLYFVSACGTNCANSPSEGPVLPLNLDQVDKHVVSTPTVSASTCS